MLELPSEIHFCYKDWLIWFLLTAVPIYCISSLSLQCHTAPVRESKAKTVKSGRRVSHHISNCSNIRVAISVFFFFSTLQVKKERRKERKVKQYPLVGETIPLCAKQVKRGGCKLMIQWEIVQAAEFLQQLPLLPPPPPSSWHGLSTLHPCPVIISRCYLPSICCNLWDSERCSHPAALALLQPLCAGAAGRPSRTGTENRTEGPKRRRGRESRTLTRTWGPDCNLSQVQFDDCCFNTAEKVHIYLLSLKEFDSVQWTARSFSSYLKCPRVLWNETSLW